MMTQKTKYIKVRMTPEEQSTLKEKLKEKKMTIATYVRSAMAEYSNTDARQRLELINNLGTFYRKFREELSWAGSNLNQSVKRANELAVAGLLPPSYIREVLMPVILETQKTLNEIKRDLEIATRRAIKL
ncbi:plasmid mobilization protein [Phocaeicola sartorii]|uniref:plasmid mobilization protein n=1 Tax=Phocaeicola sartorii TaxID=671267 RepID=UPI00397B3336